MPDVYVLRKTADAALPTADPMRRRQAQTQLDALEAFWSEWFKAETGQFKAAFQSFASTDAFEQQLELLLRQWLETHGLLGPRLAWPKEKGSPFPGLAVFEAEQAAVFFGRDRAIEDARRRLTAAAERGTPFLLIVGASGAGKSSLARAGLIPRLTTPGVVASVDLWRVARMKPGEGQGGPLAALANALIASLPELAQGDFPTPDALADHLGRGGPAAAQPIVRALNRAAETEQSRRHADAALRPALVLLVDQCEELFAHGVNEADRTAFGACLQQLVDTGDVWCVATLRADLYEPLLKEPLLKALKESGASLDLGPPGAAELAEIVRGPAAAAGLAFEPDAGKGALDERLLADAKTADSLPLLQFTLRRLFEERVDAAGKATLTHAAYDALGGLHGAIAAEAERAVAGLAAASLDALPRLLRRLAEPAREASTLTLRDAPRAEVTADAAEAALVEALLAARILIARTDAGRMSDGAAGARRRAGELATGRGRRAGEPRLLPGARRGRGRAAAVGPARPPEGPADPAGVPLAEAVKLCADFGPELPDPLTAYVTASRRRAQPRQRLVAAAAVFFLGLAVAATGAGVHGPTGAARRRRARQGRQNFQIAKRTAERVVFDIAQGLRNVQGLSAEAVRKILETAQAAFDQLAASAPDDLDLQRSRSVMLNEFGDTYLTLGDLDAALKAYRDSLAIARAPRRRRSQQHAVAARSVGVVRARSATCWWRRASSTRRSRPTATASPSRAPRRRRSAATRSGSAICRCRTTRSATCWWRRASSTRRSRPTATASPSPSASPPPIRSNTQWQRDLSVSYDKVGNVLVAQGKLDEALKAYRDSLAIVERLAAADPQQHAVAARSVGVVRQGRRRAGGAGQARRGAQGLPRQPRHPRAPRRRRSQQYAVAARPVGVVRQGRRRAGGAGQARRGAQGLPRQPRHPRAPRRRRSQQYAVAARSVGVVQQGRRRAGGAGQARRGAQGLPRQPRHPRAPRRRRSAAIRSGSATLPSAMASSPPSTRRHGDIAQALAELRKGRDIMAALVAIAPDHAQWKNDLAWFDQQIARLEALARDGGRN